MKHILKYEKAIDSSEWQFFLFDDTNNTIEYVKATQKDKPVDFKKTPSD